MCASVLELFFQMFRCPDKTLREIVRPFSYFLSRSNPFLAVQAHHHRHQERKRQGQEQSAQHDAPKFHVHHAQGRRRDRRAQVARRDDRALPQKHLVRLSVFLLLLLMPIRNDAKTVNIIVHAALSDQTKLMVAGLKFFLSSDEKPDDSDSDDDNPATDINDLVHKNRIGKKTKKKEMLIERAKRSAAKVRGHVVNDVFYGLKVYFL